MIVKGTSVKILDGPWKGRTGTVQYADVMADDYVIDIDPGEGHGGRTVCRYIELEEIG